MAQPHQLDSRDVVFLDSMVYSRNGEQVKITVKAWRYQGGPIVYEVRTLLQDFFVALTHWETARVVNTQMKGVYNRLEDLGVKFHDVFIPSRKAFDVNPEHYKQRGVVEEYVRSEYGVTTLGVIVWLTTWAALRHTNEEKERARAMLEAFLSHNVDCNPFFLSRIHAKNDTLYNDCERRTSQMHACRCVRYMLRNVADSRENWSWRDFTDMLVDIMFNRDCVVYGPLANKLFHALACYHVAGMDKFQAADVLKRSKVLTTPLGKKRRLDGDFKLALGELTVDSGIKPTTVVKFLDMGSPHVAQNSQYQQVKTTQWCARRSLTCEGVVCMADDGSMHGKPAENTSMSLVWDARANYGAAGQPMVPAVCNDVVPKRHNIY